nr:unnamed protein product [Digitaria exilis]
MLDGTRPHSIEVEGSLLPLEGSLDLGTLPGLEHNRLVSSSVRALRVPSIIPDSVDLGPLSKPFEVAQWLLHFEEEASSVNPHGFRSARGNEAFETSVPRRGILEPSSFEVFPSRVDALNAPQFDTTARLPRQTPRKLRHNQSIVRLTRPAPLRLPGRTWLLEYCRARLHGRSINSTAMLMPRFSLAAMAQFVDPAPWKPSNATKTCLESLVEVGVLPPNVDGEPPVWISPGAATEPDPPAGYVVSLVRFHERGLGVPVGRFMRALCFHYKVELHNFSPNAISQAAVFVAVCEGYLGIEAHWDLWRHLFFGELFSEGVSKGVRRPTRAGGLVLQVRRNRKDLYIPCSMVSNNQDWDKGWFYLRNDGGPADEEAGLLVLRGVTAGAEGKACSVDRGAQAPFEARLPLMQRRLPLYKMTPGADLAGTAMAAEPLPVATAVQRARRAVDRLPDDPWVVPMRPEDGYLSLGVSRSQYSRPPVPEDKAVNRALAETAKEVKDRREARRKRKDRKRKKHLAENREREEQGLSPLPTPESSPDPDGSEEDGGARSPSPFELPVSSRASPGGAAPAAASGGGGVEIVDLEAPPSTVVPASGSPSGAATAALEEPQGRGEAPERPSAVEDAPALGPGVEVPQVEPVVSTGGEEASRVTPQGEADASTGGEASRVAPQGEASVSAGGEVPGMAPQGEAGASTGGEVPGAETEAPHRTVSFLRCSLVVDVSPLSLTELFSCRKEDAARMAIRPARREKIEWSRRRRVDWDGKGSGVKRKTPVGDEQEPLSMHFSFDHGMPASIALCGRREVSHES